MVPLPPATGGQGSVSCQVEPVGAVVPPFRESVLTGAHLASVALLVLPLAPVQKWRARPHVAAWPVLARDTWRLLLRRAVAPARPHPLVPLVLAAAAQGLPPRGGASPVPVVFATKHPRCPRRDGGRKALPPRHSRHGGAGRRRRALPPRSLRRGCGREAAAARRQPEGCAAALSPRAPRGAAADGRRRRAGRRRGAAAAGSRRRAGRRRGAAAAGRRRRCALLPRCSRSGAAAGTRRRRALPPRSSRRGGGRKAAAARSTRTPHSSMLSK